MGDIRVNEIKTDAIKSIGGTSAMTISSGGAVTMASTPDING